ncbi:MAG: small multi-drug export protein [Leptospirillia bacterium]
MTENPIPPNPPPPDRPPWSQLAGSPEGRIFMLGIATALAGILILAMIWAGDRETAHTLGAITFTNVLFGRAAGLSLGYAAGFGHGLVIPINIVIETVLVLLFYPLFVFSIQRLLVIAPLAELFAKAGRTAEAHRATVHRYGMIGVMMFVWVPFWMTGPVVGCAIGYLIGLSPWRNLVAVLSATYVAIVCWAVLLSALTDRMAAVSAWVPVAFVVVLIGVAMGGHLLHGRRRTDRH